MAVILWAMGLSLLIQGCFSSMGQTERGCKQWHSDGTNVCCDVCHSGHRLVTKCGQNPEDLCTPCEPGTWNLESIDYRCQRCTHCAGAQVLLKTCNATTDAECGCKGGLTCGDKACSFCFQECGKGEEPTETRSCKPCSPGTFNDQIHQKCKPWSSSCPNPNQVIVAKADAFNDIKCSNVSTTTEPNQPTVSAVATVADTTEDGWPLALFLVPTTVLAAFIIFIIMIITVTLKRQEWKIPEKEPIKPPIIRTPTDEPCTLVAMECSFHEAQQEQGSSSESLASKDSSDPLIA